MQARTSIRRTVRGIRRRLATAYARCFFPRTVANLEAYRSDLAGKRGLEIGGPSGILGVGGPLPIYDVLESLDNCLYSSRTIWTGEVAGNASFVYDRNKQPGNQIFCEASHLGPVSDSSYECVIASHCLEHVANPLRALQEWRRVLAPQGVFLMVLPHKDGTFDWRRPTTALEHMVTDFENNVGEEDLTHLPEILALHDLRRDEAAGTLDQFRERCLDNLSMRAIHHHVFDTHTALAVVDRASFQILQVSTFRPYHIMILARRSEGVPDNAAFLGTQAEYRRDSPFRSDRLSSPQRPGTNSAN
jgi:SAM-dependent methyltransferase